MTRFTRKKRDIWISIQATIVCALLYILLGNLFYIENKPKNTNSQRTQHIIMYNLLSGDGNSNTKKLKNILIIGSPVLFAKSNLTIGYSNVLQEKGIEFSLDTDNSEINEKAIIKKMFSNFPGDFNIPFTTSLIGLSKKFMLSKKKRFKILCSGLFSPLDPPAAPFIQNTKLPPSFPLWIDEEGKILPQLFDSPKKIKLLVNKLLSLNTTIHSKQPLLKHLHKTTLFPMKVINDTVLLIILNPKPFFPSCKIIKSSGFKILDTEAIKAFRKNSMRIKIKTRNTFLITVKWLK